MSTPYSNRSRSCHSHAIRITLIYNNPPDTPRRLTLASVCRTRPRGLIPRAELFRSAMSHNNDVDDHPAPVPKGCFEKMPRKEHPGRAPRRARLAEQQCPPSLVTSQSSKRAGGAAEAGGK